jgi:hypothetical protein
MYIYTARRKGLGIVSIPERIEEQIKTAQEEVQKREEELKKQLILDRTKTLTEKYGPMIAYRIVKGLLTEAQADAEVAVKLAAWKAAAENKLVSTPASVELVPVTNVTEAKTLTPGTEEAAAASGSKNYLPWILIGLAAILFGPKLIKG